MDITTRGIRLPHGSNQITHLLGNGRPTRRALLAEIPPVVAESLPLPGNHGAGLDERESALPAWPQLGEPGAEEPISRTEARAWDSPFIHGDLMLESKNPQVRGLTGLEQ
jgi:hypothetical protein